MKKILISLLLLGSYLQTYAQEFKRGKMTVSANLASNIALAPVGLSSDFDFVFHSWEGSNKKFFYLTAGVGLTTSYHQNGSANRYYSFFPNLHTALGWETRLPNFHVSIGIGVYPLFVLSRESYSPNQETNEIYYENTAKPEPGETITSLNINGLMPYIPLNFKYYFKENWGANLEFSYPINITKIGLTYKF